MMQQLQKVDEIVNQYRQSVRELEKKVKGSLDSSLRDVDQLKTQLILKLIE